MADVSVLQRFFAFLVDAFIAGLLLSSLLIVLAAKGPLFTNINLVIIISIFLLYTCIDHIIIPCKTGFTFSRWICGYRIVCKITSLNPTVFQCAIRILTLVIIESLLALSFISLVTIFFRKDKAAIHDLASKTKVVRVINNRNSHIKTIVSLLGLLSLLLFLIAPSIASILDYIFIQRSENYIENKIISKSVITNKHTKETFYALHGIPILPTTSRENLNVYRMKEHLFPDSETYLVKVGEVELIFDIAAILTLGKLLKIEMISHVLNFNDVAYNSFAPIKQRYRIFHPIDSYAVLCLRLVHAAIARPENERLLFSVYNDNYFANYYIKEKRSQTFLLYIEMYDGDSLNAIIVKPKNKIDSSKTHILNAHNEAIKSIIRYGQFTSSEGYKNAHILNQ
jgi:uncharacterized RDD family membrane protein YckC